jgi:hypothetical protein
MRTKKEVLLEHFGNDDIDAAQEYRFETAWRLPLPPVDQWTRMEIPYKAPNHPPLPSFEDIDQAMVDNRISSPINYAVCRIGNLVVKEGNDPRVAHVGI